MMTSAPQKRVRNTLSNAANRSSAFATKVIIPNSGQKDHREREFPSLPNISYDEEDMSLFAFTNLDRKLSNKVISGCIFLSDLLRVFNEAPQVDVCYYDTVFFQ